MVLPTLGSPESPLGNTPSTETKYTKVTATSTPIIEAEKTGTDPPCLKGRVAAKESDTSPLVKALLLPQNKRFENAPPYDPSKFEKTPALTQEMIVKGPDGKDYVEVQGNVYRYVGMQTLKESRESHKSDETGPHAPVPTTLGVKLEDADAALVEFVSKVVEKTGRGYLSDVPKDFMVACFTNPMRSVPGFRGKGAAVPPRAELRLVPGAIPPVIANIALAFPGGATRDAAFKEFKKMFGDDISLVSAGRTTIEIGNPNVDKATTINYLNDNFDTLLAGMKYQPGSTIDARTNRTVVIADADGTIWGKPPAEDPEVAHLGNSSGKEDVLSYLRGGGVLVINSGNDPQRVINRLLKGIPEGERAVLCSRVLVAAAGGHTLLKINLRAALERAVTNPGEALFSDVPALAARARAIELGLE